MIERVRAILITSDNTMLAIKRIRPDVEPHWVLPGGGVEPTDSDREAALERELFEEIAGRADILALLYILTSETDRHFFHLARIESWCFAERTGPEFSEAGRGEYVLEQVSLTVEALDAINLKPTELAIFLRDALQAEGGLLAQPDLRHSQAFR